MKQKRTPYVVEVVEEFLRTKAAREDSTKASYSSILLGSERGTRKPLGLPFSVYFHNRKFGSLSHDEVSIWFAQRIKNGKQATKHRVSKGARQFLNWALSRGYTTDDLASAIDPFAPGQGTRGYLSFSEVSDLLRAITENRYRFAAQWLFYTGARVGEACAARHREVRWRQELAMFEWSIPNSKTHTPRTVYLPDELAAAYRRTIATNKAEPNWPILWDSEGRGFARRESPAASITPRTINSALARARAAIDLTTPVTAHVARHSFCTCWVHEQGRNDFSLERLSRQVGTSPEVLRRTYVHFDLTPGDLAAIKAFGRASTS
jgi:integrase